MKQGRYLRLPSQEQHAALREMRSFLDSEEGRRLYAKRAGIEGTISQGVRSFGLRRARYRGEAKAHLQHVANGGGDELQPGLGLAGGRAASGDADVAIRAAGGLIGIRQQYRRVSRHPGGSRLSAVCLRPGATSASPVVSGLRLDGPIR